MVKDEEKSGGQHYDRLATLEIEAGTPAAQKLSEFDSESKIGRVTGICTRNPILSCMGCASFLFLITMVGAAANLLYSSPPGSYEWIIASTEESQNTDAFDSAIGEVDSLQNATSGTRTEISDLSKVFFQFETKDDSDIFSPANLQVMCEVESKIAKDADFENFCRIGASGECEIPVTSIVQMFYNFPDVASWECDLLPEQNVTATKSMIYDAVDTDEGKINFGIFVGSETPTDNFSPRTQSIWYFGAPLEGYDGPGDDFAEQFDKYKNFLAAIDGSVDNIEKELFEYFDMETNEDALLQYFPTPYRYKAETEALTVRWWGIALRENEFSRLLTSDMLFAMFSMMFVFIYLRLYIGSTWLACVGLFQIFFSLPVTLFVYRVVYRIDFWAELHGLTLFIVLGVGADDVFVFIDGWRQTAYLQREAGTRDVSHERLYLTYVHTAQAVFNTSFTTAFAFIATGQSPLMPISTFGYYAATCIVLNYILTMTLTPPAVIMADKFFCWKPGISKYDCACKEKVISETSALGTEKTKPDGNKFIENIYIPALEAKIGNVPAASIAVFSILLAYGIFNTTQAVQLQPPQEQEKWFPDNHMFTIAEEKMTNSYISGDDTAYAVIDMTFGVKGIDRGDFNQYKPNVNRGNVVWDTDYDLASPQCQTVLAKACADIKTFSCTEHGCAPINLLARTDTTRCFFEEFQQWAVDNGHGSTTAMDSETFYEHLITFRNEEIPAADENSNWEKDIGFVNGDLRYASFSYVATLEVLSSMDTKTPVLERTEEFIKHVKNYPECSSGCDCKSFMQSTSFAWTWLRTEQGLLFGFYQGLSICFPVAFGVLLLSTGNIFLALYAIVAVFFIVFGVLGFVKGLGWDLGVAESVAGIIIVGFSVDYTVHLGHMYCHGAHKGFHDRKHRFEYAARKMVMTVIAGAITTFGAGVFMFFCQMLFFVKMATLICGTIVLSFFYSLGFFMAALYMMGPEGTFGDLPLDNIKSAIGWGSDPKQKHKFES